MGSGDFEMRLLIRQNTQMSARLQTYRRQNEELARQNENLNIWVQNLSDVFAAITAAWRVITDNEQTLYALVAKKTDSASKGFINKYAGHFKTFEEIIDCLGQKLTNEGHSNATAIDAKDRISSFVNNYLLFFKEFADAYFRHNEDYLTFLHEKTEQGNLQNMMKMCMNREIEHRQKIKELEPFIVQLKDNLKNYESYGQHKMQDGLLLQKEKLIESLRIINERQSRRLAFMVDYNSQNVEFLLDDQKQFECYCGGKQLKYYHSTWEEALKQNQEQKQSKKMIDEGSQISEVRLQQFQELQTEKELLLQRNIQLQNKIQKIKLQNRLTEDSILKSPVYMRLKIQCFDMINYTNQLVHRLNKQYEYLQQIQKQRLQEINEIHRKQKKPLISSKLPEQQLPVIDNSFLINFKNSVLKQLEQINKLYKVLSVQSRDREDKLVHTRDLIKQIRKDNEELHKKFNEVQERQIKSVEQMEYRHKHFNEVENAINQMFKQRTGGEQTSKLKKIWGEYVEYVKTRDKKIRAMEEHIRKKDKEIGHKAKVQETLKAALAETETIYLQAKEKLDRFEQSMFKIEKDILSLSEECYRLKIQSQQEKNFLNIRLKSQIEVKQKLEERVRAYEKIENELFTTKKKESDLETKFQEFLSGEREKINRLSLQLKEKQHQKQQFLQLISQKERILTRLIEEKQKKNLEMNKMQLRIKAIEEKNEFEMIRMEMEEYKSKIMCRCGAEREREIALMSCPHIFCRKCIEDTTTHRNRKCPICGIRFTKNEIHEIVWT